MEIKHWYGNQILLQYMWDEILLISFVCMSFELIQYSTMYNKNVDTHISKNKTCSNDGTQIDKLNR